MENKNYIYEKDYKFYFNLNFPNIKKNKLKNKNLNYERYY